MNYILGVDVGTTYTAAAIWRRREGRADIVALGNQANTIPTVVFLRPDDQWLVGEAANRRAVSEPDRVAREFKRRVGDRVPVLVGGRPFTAHTLVGVLLAQVVDQVSQREGSPPERLLVTCPANWHEYRRGLLVEAARQAGVGEITLLSEPVAAATWYASLERLDPGALVGVYDLGGGTFDAAVLRTTGASPSADGGADDAGGGAGFELCGEPAGEEQLGGIDFDQAILEHVAAVVGEQWSALDLTEPAVLSAVAQVRAAATDAKESLSTDLDAAIPVVLPGWTGHVRLTRAEFEEAIRPALDRTVATFELTLRSAGVTPEQLHTVLLAGGSSRIPLVAELLTRRLRVQVAIDAHPKFAVCQGAAIAGAIQLGLATRHSFAAGSPLGSSAAGQAGQAEEAPAAGETNASAGTPAGTAETVTTPDQTLPGAITPDASTRAEARPQAEEPGRTGASRRLSRRVSRLLVAAAIAIVATITAVVLAAAPLPPGSAAGNDPTPSDPGNSAPGTSVPGSSMPGSSMPGTTALVTSSTPDTTAPGTTSDRNGGHATSTSRRRATSTTLGATTTSTNAQEPTTTPTTAVQLVTVPNVVGLDKFSAISELRGVGLRATISNSGSQGDVIRQSPVAGRQVAPGSRVLLTLRVIIG